MYQAWPWGTTTTATASPNAIQTTPAPTGQEVGNQWPAGYNQYAAMTPEIQQQWAAAWAQQYAAYGSAMPVAGSEAYAAYQAPKDVPKEKPKESSQELGPNNQGEQEKLKQLQEQAQHWKTLQQPTMAWPYTAPPSAGVTTTVTSAEPPKVSAADQAQIEQEEEFEKQFRDWEKQFDAWKEQNQNHPDKEAFAQYEKQWHEWRAQLLQKKEQMQKAKAERLAAANVAVSSGNTAVDPNSAMYYQQQYMQQYMQQYNMYSGATQPPPSVPPFAFNEGYNNATENHNEGNNQDREQYGYREGFPPDQVEQYPPGQFDEYGGNNYPPQEMGDQFPRDMNFGRGGRARGRGRGARGRGRGRGGRWSEPNQEMQGPMGDNPEGFPGEYPPGPDGGFSRGPDGYPRGSRDFPPMDEKFPKGPGEFRDGPPPYEYPPDDFGYPRDGEPPRQRRKMDGPMRNSKPALLDGPPGPPPEPFNDRFGDDGPYGPPFPDDFPPYDDFHPGPFRGRGRRFQRGFDRFGPPGFDDGNFGPHPDDRFPFPDDCPPRMGRGRGGRRGFGPRFQDEPYFREDGPPPFKDYSHRPPEDFDPHYEYENEFQNDVRQFRDNFSTELKSAFNEPVIFSQVKVESIDYGHGIKTPVPPSDTSPKQPDQPPVKVFDYSHQGGRSSPFKNDDFLNDVDVEPPFIERVPPPRFPDRSRFSPEWESGKERGGKRGRFQQDENLDYDYREQRKEREPRDKDYRRNESERHRTSRWESSKTDNERSTERSSSNHKKERDSKSENDSGRSKSHSNSSSTKSDTSSEAMLIDDILLPPKRNNRPKQLVIILRGLPGSGKSYVAKLMKDKEIENGGSAPRILCLDDYFMAEVEVNDVDPDTGKKIKRKEFKYEYEAQMEESYRNSLFKSFKKTIDDRFFPFIIVDAVHDQFKHYEQFWSYAKPRGFQVYIGEMDCKDPVICYKRNTHDRTLEDITKILESWEQKPRHFMSIDIRSLLQDIAITEVEMEVESETKEKEDKEDSPEEEADEDTVTSAHEPSRWEKLEATEEKLDQLDGLKAGKMKHNSMEDFLQLPDDYEERKCEPGKKRVRWADLEERKEQDRLRAIGFVVGQTDWNKMTDPSHADRALTKTKYF